MKLRQSDLPCNLTLYLTPGERDIVVAALKLISNEKAQTTGQALSIICQEFISKNTSNE